MSDAIGRSPDDIVCGGEASSVIGEYPARDILASTKRADRVVAVKRYDFRRPDKFSREELRTLSIIHETLARANTATLSALLRFDCMLRIRAVDQLNFGEYLAAVDASSPSGAGALTGLMSLPPLPGNFVFSVTGALAAAIIELLGGAESASAFLPSPSTADGTLGAASERQVTELERDALSAVFTRLAEDLAEAWRPILEVEGRFDGLERRDGRNIRILSEQEMVVFITFDCAVGEARGELTFALPFLLLEPIIPKLTARWYYAPKAGFSKSFQPALALSRLPLASSLYYEVKRLSIARLAALKRGTLLPLVEGGEGPLVFEAGGKPLLRMKRAGKKRSYAVTAKTAQGPASAALSAAKDGGAGEEGEAEAGEAEARTAIARLAEGLGKTVARMERKLDEVRARQDELADQAFFGKGADRGEGEAEDRPLAFAEGLDRSRLAAFLSLEHPQTAALVLSCLDGAPAGDLLSRLPPPLQSEVARRIARIRPASPLLFSELEATLRRRGDLGRGEGIRFGGLEHLAEMRSAASPMASSAIAEILGERG